MTYPTAAERYETFLGEIFGTTRSPSVRDSPLPDAAEHVSELEIQARWFAGEFGRDFIGRDGEVIEIVQFGHWNRSAGPDFTEAAVRIDGELRRGPIEVDLEAADWERHGHGANPAFDEVVLQVSFVGRNADTPRFFTRNSRHEAITQLPLDLSITEEPAQYWGHLPVARRGRCATPLKEMEPAALESLMISAAQYRLVRKARRFAAMAEAHSASQALFQSTAEALGYRHNKLTMALLAQRLPLSLLRRQEPDERESLLFGVAGFLDAGQFESAADAEARRYLKSLWDHWWKHRAEHEPEADNRRLHWRLAGARPTNHPQRRVAALGGLVNGWTRFRQLVAAQPEGKSAAWAKALRNYLGGLEHPYWQHHYTLRARPSEKPLALIGKDRIQDLLGNVLFPAAIPTRPALWKAYLNLPGSVANESLKRASLRLFGADHSRAASATKRYWQQQALLQIYRDFCLVDGSDCADCPFPEQLSQWRAGV